MQSFVSLSTLLSLLDGVPSPAQILLRNSPLRFRIPRMHRVFIWPFTRGSSDTRHVPTRIQGLGDTRHLPCSRVESNPSNPAFEGWEQSVKSRIRGLSTARHITHKWCKELRILENTITYFHSREREYCHDWSLNVEPADSRLCH